MRRKIPFAEFFAEILGAPHRRVAWNHSTRSSTAQLRKVSRDVFPFLLKMITGTYLCEKLTSICFASNLCLDLVVLRHVFFFFSFLVHF
jgi:hypothetical protein